LSTNHVGCGSRAGENEVNLAVATVYSFGLEGLTVRRLLIPSGPFNEVGDRMTSKTCHDDIWASFDGQQRGVSR
jgi:hypothetical protein